MNKKSSVFIPRIICGDLTPPDLSLQSSKQQKSLQFKQSVENGGNTSATIPNRFTNMNEGDDRQFLFHHNSIGITAYTNLQSMEISPSINWIFQQVFMNFALIQQYQLQQQQQQQIQQQYYQNQKQDEVVQRTNNKNNQKDQYKHNDQNIQKNKGRNNNCGGNSNQHKRFNQDKKLAQSTHHTWLASTNLKGQSDDIRDINFKTDGKYTEDIANQTNTTNNHHSPHRLIRSNHHRHHGLRHRKITTSSSTDSATGSGSDDINCSSSNEDISSLTYHSIKATKKTKCGRSRRQRKNQSNVNRHQTSMDIDEEAKDNHQQHHRKSTTSLSSVAEAEQTAVKSSIQKNQKSTAKSESILVSSGQTTLRSSNSKLNYQSTLLSSASTFIGGGTDFVKINRALTPPLRQHTKLNLQETELIKFLRYYIIDPNLLRIYGYPVETEFNDGTIEIFKCLPRPFTHYKTTTSTIRNNIGAGFSENSSQNKNNNYNIINKNDGLSYSTWSTSTISPKDKNHISSSVDSGQGDSGSSSPPSIDSDDTSETGEEDITTTTFYTPDGKYQIFNNYNQSLEKQCCRCKKTFLVNDEGEYLTFEECNYHWGKINQVYTNSFGLSNQYSCCNKDELTEGCTKNRLHVWTGATVGINGPYDDFVWTKDSKKSTILSSMKKNKNQNTSSLHTSSSSLLPNVKGNVFALDCEMCYTGLGLDLTKVTIISSDGQLVYEHFVRPKCEIIDYNTRFSGISEKDLQQKNVKTLKQVQNDILQFINSDTLLIGHSLENDLRSLKICHKNIIDTSISFPHLRGFPYRRSLKTLTKLYLNRDIQTGEKGHCSFEDSRACLELMLWRVRKDFRLELEQ